ncbi:unnamed protein product [Clavelina lepadiformis]|uniref:Sulfotransferase n=1 Tax=Clavelina lepadiformis TaxID=159417 RepID=A0ABP0GRW1_CLALP
MKCKNLCVVFLLACGLGACYVAINWNQLITQRSYTTQRHRIEDNEVISKHSWQRLTTKKTPNPRRTDAVILLTQRRSGSSVLGELFNQRSDVTYLYEPLFPFVERPCDVQHKERVEVLRHITKCELEQLPSLYDKGFNVSNKNDIWSRCKIYNICFPSNQGKAGIFLARDAGICKLRGKGEVVCPKPIDHKDLEKHCRQSLLVAMKVIYLCKLEWLTPLLRDEEFNVKIIHLVRDPRATVNSRTSPTKRNINYVRSTAASICEQLSANLKFVDQSMHDDSWTRDRYMRISHEEFSMDPIKTAQKIYDFVEINMTPYIKSWISEATSTKNDSNLSQKESQKTARNSTLVLSAWRKSLNFDEVLAIQDACPYVLSRLGYQKYNSLSELRDLSKLHFDL